MKTRKVAFVISVAILLCCSLAISAFAYYELKHEYTYYSLEMAGARLGVDTYSYDSVGYSYLNAVPNYHIPNAYFTTSICSYEKLHWYSLTKTWVDLTTQTAHMNSTVYWGMGVSGHNNGQQFGFKLIPYNHIVDGGDDNPSISYPIIIESFRCESSEQ